MRTKITIVCIILFFQVSCGESSQNRTGLGLEYAKSELKNALLNKTEKQILVDTLIPDKATAISISETILSRIYGRENIVKQRPYEINKINEYWVLNGTLPKKMLGGTFLIILNSTNGQVIKLTHRK